MDKPSIHPYIPIMIGVITLAFSAIFVKLVSADA
ncbi:EamA family transporter, partial [Bhargavaea beijingensis]